MFNVNEVGRNICSGFLKPRGNYERRQARTPPDRSFLAYDAPAHTAQTDDRGRKTAIPETGSSRSTHRIAIGRDRHSAATVACYDDACRWNLLRGAGIAALALSKANESPMQYFWRLRCMVLISVVVATAAARNLTTCDFGRPSDLAGRVISVSTRIGFTMHGAYLLSDSCAGRAEDAVLLFPKTAGTPPVNFEIDPSAVGSLSPFFKPTGGTATACGVLRGQVVVKNRFHRGKAGAGPVGNGFGSRGAFRYAFVLQSVTEVHSCE